MKTRLIVIPCFMLALASVFSVPSAVAQSQEVCPKPPGFPAPPPNLVTAAHVENGDATLQEFVRGFFQFVGALRQHSDAAGYVGCLLTNEGPFYSGSTYFVSLTLSGRVDLHGKNAALSGGLLDPDIFAQITRAAGSSPVGGPFRVEAASADSYAVGGARNPDGSPAILVAGFDLQESHLVPEFTAPDDVPAVTARDVVDRRTLKAFVNGAIAYFLRRFEAEGYEAALKIKRVFRDPNGPWRAGPVYLFVIDRSGFTLFHGAFPEKFELQTPTDTLRDVVTGELILPQIIEAATRSEAGGGFVEYHFDNPDDDTDSAEIPKVTYADAIVATAPEGAAVGSQTLIVGAGIYGDPVSKESTAAAKNWLSRFGRAVAGQAVDMIGDRLASQSSGETQVRIAGQTLSFNDPRTYKSPAGGARDFGLTDERGGTSRSLSAQELLLGSSFHLSFGADGSGAGGRQSFWGRVALTEFDGGSDTPVDGRVTTGMLGADYEWGRTLAGLAVSHSTGDGGFAPAGGADTRSQMEASLTSAHPYIRIELKEGWSAWGLAGYGTGEMSLEEDDIERRVETDITMTMGALGLRGDILSASGASAFDLALKSDLQLMKIESDEKAGLPSIAAQGSRVRLSLEGSHTIELEQGGELRPSLELGVLHESGDAATGAGLELGSRLRYSDPDSGVSMEARGRVLMGLGEDDDDYEEWGVGGAVRVQPQAAGSGLSLSVEPSWGVVSNGTEALWSRPGAALLRPGEESVLGGRLDAELGYGIGMTGRQEMLTPYAGVALTSGGARDWRMGWRYRFGPSFHADLQGVRREGAGDGDAPDHGVTLRGVARW